MNREILFRGKSTISKEWVYGDLVQTSQLTAIKEVNGDYFRPVSVNSDTIGQYTGLKDKEGNKIFEGDIIESNGYRHIVMYNEDLAGFCSANVKYPEDLCGINQQWINECDKVVIGNVTDNPELMK